MASHAEKPEPAQVIVETPTNMMFFVKCFNPAQTLYACYVTTWVEAFAMAHLLAEVYESRVNVYRPDENAHCYSVSSSPDVTARYFT